MALTKRKGAGAGGCCCGGCKQSPGIRTAGEQQLIPAVQQYCCRCIPSQICLTVTQGSYDTQTILVERICAPAEDDIQYTTTIDVSGVERVFNVRLLIVDELCYISWDIPALSLSDTVLIDQNEAPTAYVCTHGMTQKKCVEFGGEWTVVSPAMTITIEEPASLDLKGNVECGGCNCHCDCLCMSIYSRNATTGVFTLVGTNEIVCSVKTQTYLDACGDPEFLLGPAYYSWTSNGWTITLGDQSEYWFDSYTIVTGTEGSLGACAGADGAKYATAKGDGIEHIITDAGAQVIYDFELDYRTAIYLKWVGRSYTETSSILFEAWNWSTLAWVTVETMDGRPVTTSINRGFQTALDAAYTGTGADDGKVRIRLTLVDGTEMRTDMLHVVANECCAWRLTPPGDVTLLADPTTVPLVFPNECPSPSAFWSLEGYDGTEWYVSAECSWCGGLCGVNINGCCPRVLPNILFAEIDLTCPTCSTTTISLPLVSDGTGSIWSGTVTVCGGDMLVTFLCSGTAWHITVTLNSCTFDADETSSTCDPLLVTFSGTLGGGLGCCGPSGDPFATPNISITVIE